MTPVADATQPSGWRVANLIAQIAFGLLLMTLPLPSMPDWRDSFGVAQATVQLTFGLYVLAYGVSQVLAGPLSDRHGRRPVLQTGLVIAAAGSLLGAGAADIVTLLLARVLQGVGAGAAAVAGRASVQDAFHGAARTRVMAYVGMAMGLCPPLATLLGGQLHVRLGWQANFVVMAAVALALWVAARLGLPAPPPRRADSARGGWLTEMLRAYRRLLGDRVFALNVAVLALTVATFYAFLSGAPLVLRSYGVGADHMGLYIMAVPLSYIAGNFLTSRMAHRFAELRLLAAGQAFTLAGVALVLALGLAGRGSALAFVLPLMLLGIGHGLLTPTLLTRTIGLVPALAGAAAAVAGLMQQLVGAFGGYVVGWFPHDGVVNLAAVMLAFTLAAVATQAPLHGRRPRPQSPSREGS